MNEKFADPIDYGSNLADIMNNAAIEKHRFKPEQHKVEVIGEDGIARMEWPITDCVSCGEPIEAPRIEMGMTKCVMCKELEEKADALRAKR